MIKFRLFHIQATTSLVLFIVALSSYGQSTTLPEWFGADDDVTQWSITFAVQGQPAPPAKKQVLFIYSKASPAYDQAFTTIATALDNYHFDAGYTLVNFRTSPELTQNLLMSDDFDLAFIAGSSATSALYKRFPKPELPVVTVTTKDPVLLGLIDSYQAAEDSGDVSRKYAFTSLNIQSDSLISYLQTLNPDLKAIGILYGENNRSALKTQVLPLMASAKKTGIAVKVSAISEQATEASLKHQLPTMFNQLKAYDSSQDDTLLWLTGSTLLFNYLESIDQLAGHIPLLTAVPDLVSSSPASPMMSIGTSFASNAALAAVYGRQILNGSITPSQLPVGALSPPDIAINFQKVRESGWKVPVRMFELATILYNSNGQPVQQRGMQVEPPRY